MRALFSVLFAAFLVVSVGCRDDKGGDREEPRGEEGERGEGPGDDEHGGPEVPFPPPGAVKAPPPPGVQVLMEKMVNAFAKKDVETVKGLFIKRTTFLVVSDCDPADVVDRVMDGARHSADRAVREGEGVHFEGFVDGEGYLIDVKEGEKPAECRAKRPAKIYLAKFDWTIGGKKEQGEAHFLNFNDVWFFVKL